MGGQIPHGKGQFWYRRLLSSIGTSCSELCKNSWTGRSAVWVVDSSRPKDAQVQLYLHAFINILDSLTAPCLVYNTAMYTVYGRVESMASAWFIHGPVWPVRGIYGPERNRGNESSRERKVSGTQSSREQTVPETNVPHRDLGTSSDHACTMDHARWYSLVKLRALSEEREGRKTLTWTWCISESKSSNWRYRGRKLKLIYIPFCL